MELMWQEVTDISWLSQTLLGAASDLVLPTSRLDLSLSVAGEGAGNFGDLRLLYQLLLGLLHCLSLALLYHHSPRGLIFSFFC